MSAIPPSPETNSFDVEIDEAQDGSGNLQLDISAPAWAFRFNVTARQDLDHIVRFLREQMGRLVFSELVAGSFCGARVMLVKDSEFADRFWLRVFGQGLMVECTLVGSQAAELATAIAQAAGDRW